MTFISKESFVDGSSGGGEVEPEPQSEGYDPGEYTIAEVQEYVTDHPDELDDIYAAEESGKARITLLDWLSTQQ